MQLVQRLIKRGVIPADQLTRVSEAHFAAPTKPLHELLIEKGFAKEEDVLAALAEEFGMDLVDLTKIKVEPETLKAMPLKLVHRRTLMPLSRRNGTLVVATGDPYDVYALDELQMMTGLQIQPVLASPREIARLIKTHFGVGGETVSAMMAERDDVELLEGLETDDSEAAKMAQEASVVKLVNEILVEAANERASDIHVEPEEGTLRIRYRIDGILQTQSLHAEINRFQAAIISRIKIMSRLNIAEKRLPQDGRIKMRVQGRDVDVRVSIIPMIHGEGIVMRLLDKGRMVFNLANVGMLPDTYKLFKKLIDLPHGIILVTGPTGSGKSTTLYSALNEIKEETLKIITVEDPVEYQQPGISQIQVHSKINLTFTGRPPQHPAPRPRRDPHRRNARQGNRGQRHPGVADRPYGLQYAAHQRRPQRLHPAHRHGRRTVPRGQHGGRRHGPAAGADDLPRMQGAVRAARGAVGFPAQRRRSGAFVARRRLPGMPAERLPRPDGHL